MEELLKKLVLGFAAAVAALFLFGVVLNHKWAILGGACGVFVLIIMLAVIDCCGIGEGPEQKAFGTKRKVKKAPIKAVHQP